jgi:hypothetical protein
MLATKRPKMEQEHSALTQFLFNIVLESKTPIENNNCIFLVWDDKSHFDEWWNAKSATPEERKSQKLKDIYILKAKSSDVKLDLKDLKEKVENVCLLCGALVHSSDPKEITDMKIFFYTAITSKNDPQQQNNELNK